MRRLTSLALALLAFNAGLTGAVRACEHEGPAEAASVAHAHGSDADHPAPVPPAGEGAPCDDAQMCCEAMTSCAVSGVVSRVTSRHAFAPFPDTFLAVSDREPASTALEIATPPPKRA